LARSTDQRWFIQLYAVNIDDYADIEYYLSQTIAKKIPSHELRAYVSDLSGRERIGVIYGDFASSAEASAAIRSLPHAMKITKPYPRQAIKLRSAR
jgi:septal ring-binding cell division protein DamX